ncbi:helix-turn-helix domain-containing protein [Streptomyces sp. NPDC096013]|uniref:helix-turn-helix domain-containing protein n=1 Tax=Streptomyces sp. NPDC096013 TaxID=3366069 RepID=UPI003816C5A8
MHASIEMARKALCSLTVESDDMTERQHWTPKSGRMIKIRKDRCRVPRDLPEDDDWIRARQQEIGQRIRAERLRRNLTQERVFLAAGRDRRTLQAIETGTANPTLVPLLRLPHALGVPLADLVN